LPNPPAETQRNTKLVERNNQDYVRIDKSKGEDFCSGTDCYGKANSSAINLSSIADASNPTGGFVINGEVRILVLLEACNKSSKLSFRMLSPEPVMSITSMSWMRLSLIFKPDNR
jgi:hypothetical protein